MIVFDPIMPALEMGPRGDFYSSLPLYTTSHPHQFKADLTACPSRLACIFAASHGRLSASGSAVAGETGKKAGMPVLPRPFVVLPSPGRFAFHTFAPATGNRKS